MRVCPSCSETKDATGYYRKHGRCKECDKAATAAYYRANLDACRARQRSYYWADPDRSRGISKRTRVKRKAVRTALVRQAKDRPCVDCGKQYPPVAMDLDHVRGSKVAQVTLLVHRLAPLSVIRTEIAKCDVRCANCHRLRHARETS